MMMNSRTTTSRLAVLILLGTSFAATTAFTRDAARSSYRSHKQIGGTAVVVQGGKHREGTSAPALSSSCQQNICSGKVHLSSLSSDDDQSQSSSSTLIRYLGKGGRAIVRPGVVLVAPGHESSHFLMKSAIFIHAMGLDEYGESVTRGVIIDHPTAFTMGEMGGGSVVGVLGNNILFRGGDCGRDSAILLHSHGDAIDGSSAMIGTSDVCEGGLQAAMEAADEGNVDPDNFKFFFNYVQFTDNEIENMLEEEDSAGDAWMSVEVPHAFVLDGDYDRGEAWSYLRNQIKQMNVEP